MDLKQIRIGAAALLAGGALLGGLLFSGALVSAQTPEPSPSADEEADMTPDSTGPSVTPEDSQTPADEGEGNSDGAGSRDGECDKDGDGEPDGATSGGARSAGPGGGLPY